MFSNLEQKYPNYPLYRSQTRENVYRNYLTIFLSILISLQGSQKFLNEEKMFCDRPQVNEKGMAACSLATLGGDKPLEFFSQGTNS